LPASNFQASFSFIQISKKSLEPIDWAGISKGVVYESPPPSMIAKNQRFFQVSPISEISNQVSRTIAHTMPTASSTANS
jgi:hypothetical protein